MRRAPAIWGAFVGLVAIAGCFGDESSVSLDFGRMRLGESATVQAVKVSGRMDGGTEASAEVAPMEIKPVGVWYSEGEREQRPAGRAFLVVAYRARAVSDAVVALPPVGRGGFRWSDGGGRVLFGTEGNVASAPWGQVLDRPVRTTPLRPTDGWRTFYLTFDVPTVGGSLMYAGPAPRGGVTKWRLPASTSGFGLGAVRVGISEGPSDRLGPDSDDATGGSRGRSQDRGGHKIAFRVLGPGTADITWTDGATSSAHITGIELPWSHETTLANSMIDLEDRSELPSVTATSSGREPLACELLIDGRTVASQEASGRSGNDSVVSCGGEKSKRAYVDLYRPSGWDGY